MADGEVTERLLDLVEECVADGTMQYESGDDGKIYVRLVESGALFEVVSGGLIRRYPNSTSSFPLTAPITKKRTTI